MALYSLFESRTTTMSASALRSALEGTTNESEKRSIFESWVEENLEPGDELHWDLDDLRSVWECFENDAVRGACTEAFAEAFDKINGTLTCEAVEVAISTTTNESLKLSMVEYCASVTTIALRPLSSLLLTSQCDPALAVAPCVRDAENRQILLDAFSNRAVQMSVEDVKLGRSRGSAPTTDDVHADDDGPPPEMTGGGGGGGPPPGMFGGPSSGMFGGGPPSGMFGGPPSGMFGGPPSGMFGGPTTVTFGGVMPGMNEMADSFDRAKLHQAFMMFDADGSGKLNAAEFLQVLTRSGGGLCPLSEEDAQEIIDDFDKNGDGELDFSEFLETANEMGLFG